MAKIKILTGSTRPGRFNIHVAEWVYKQVSDLAEGSQVELVDIADLNLPLLDEGNPPMMQSYEKTHTKKWSAIVDDADGFIVVTPEYNHSIPAALKNAFDYLYKEWNFKPIAFVSYGSGAGGSRAVEHLRAVAGEQKMYDLREQVMLPNYWNNMSETHGYQFTEEQAQLLEALTHQLVFWANHMKQARADMHASAK